MMELDNDFEAILQAEGDPGTTKVTNTETNQTVYEQPKYRYRTSPEREERLIEVMEELLDVVKDLRRTKGN